MMASKINPPNPLRLYDFPTRKPNPKPQKHTKLSYSLNPKPQTTPITTTQPSKQSSNTNTRELYSVSFKTLGSGKLGISRYPDFEYDPRGGFGSGTASKIIEGEVFSVCFDVDTLYIPSLTSQTTKFLGLPLPPFLKIDILPEVFQGTIDRQSGKVELEFRAKFCFTAAEVYKAPPLVVETVLTTEETTGERKRGRGERLDSAGNCRLVGVAAVEAVDGDIFLNTFLSLPSECLADLQASISLSPLPHTLNNIP